MKKAGSVLLFIGVLVGGFGAFHVFLDKGGKISAREALPALYAGILLAVIGLVLAVIGAKKAQG